jgi:hypothetical protein
MSMKHDYALYILGREQSRLRGKVFDMNYLEKHHEPINRPIRDECISRLEDLVSAIKALESLNN